MFDADALAPWEFEWVTVDGQLSLQIKTRKPTWGWRLKFLAMLPLTLMGVLNAGTFFMSRVGAGYALDLVFGRSVNSLTARTVYVGLFVSAATPSDSTATAAGRETVATGYARQAYGPTTPTAADPPVTGNTSIITFGPLSGTLAAIPNFGIFSASSGTTGDFLGYGAWATSRTPTSGDSLQIAASGLTTSVGDQ